MPTLRYYGHSAFRVQGKKHTLFIDPFLSGNPVCNDDPANIKQCDYVLLTHAHGDHFGDAVEIAKAHNATIIASYEVAVFCESKGCKAHQMGAGGSFDFPFGSVKMVPAIHGCGADPWRDGTVPPPNTPVGMVITIDEKVLYHAGDTALFSDMKLIAEDFDIDVACLPIGDNYTMGIKDAAKAAEWLGAKNYVPIHYNTFPIIKADPLIFAYHVEKLGKRCTVMSPGEKFEF